MKLNVIVMSIALLTIFVCITLCTANLSNTIIVVSNTSDIPVIAINQYMNQTIHATSIHTVKETNTDTFPGSSRSGEIILANTNNQHRAPINPDFIAYQLNVAGKNDSVLSTSLQVSENGQRASVLFLH